MNATRLIAGAASTLGVGAFGWLLFVRDQTTDSDTTGEQVSRVDVTRGAGALGDRAVEVLSRHVGERGSGPKETPGYHRGKFVDEVCIGVHYDGKGLLGKPWCARAVRYAFEVAAQELGLRPPFAALKGTLAMAAAWKKSPFDQFKLLSPKVGAALILGDSHATLVAKVVDAHNVITVEGNHGDAVANVKRTIKPDDTIIDVEAYIASASGGRWRPETHISGLGLLGAYELPQGVCQL